MLESGGRKSPEKAEGKGPKETNIQDFVQTKISHKMSERGEQSRPGKEVEGVLLSTPFPSAYSTVLRLLSTYFLPLCITEPCKMRRRSM